MNVQCIILMFLDLLGELLGREGGRKGEREEEMNKGVSFMLDT